MEYDQEKTEGKQAKKTTSIVKKMIYLKVGQHNNNKQKYPVLLTTIILKMIKNVSSLA